LILLALHRIAIELARFFSTLIEIVSASIEFAIRFPLIALAIELGVPLILAIRRIFVTRHDT
jgi:ABC-type Co2+ transport system permease subunit